MSGPGWADSYDVVKITTVELVYDTERDSCNNVTTCLLIHSTAHANTH